MRKNINHTKSHDFFIKNNIMYNYEDYDIYDIDFDYQRVFDVEAKKWVIFDEKKGWIYE